MPTRTNDSGFTPSQAPQHKACAPGALGSPLALHSTMLLRIWGWGELLVNLLRVCWWMCWKEAPGEESTRCREQTAAGSPSSGVPGEQKRRGAAASYLRRSWRSCSDSRAFSRRRSQGPFLCKPLVPAPGGSRSGPESASPSPQRAMSHQGRRQPRLQAWGSASPHAQEGGVPAETAPGGRAAGVSLFADGP